MPKYNKTPHLSFSPNWHGDDTRLIDETNLLNKPLIQLEKLDGENSCIYRDGHHARSIDSKMTPWRGIIATIHGQIRHLLNPGEIVYGENMFAIHSILYENLDNYFYVFGIVQDDMFLSWDDMEKRAKELGLETVPVINHYKPFQTTKDLKTHLQRFLPDQSYYGSTIEGYVVRNSESFHKSEFDKNVAKYVRSSHVQTDTHWTKTWKRATLKHA